MSQGRPCEAWQEVKYWNLSQQGPCVIPMVGDIHSLTLQYSNIYSDHESNLPSEFLWCPTFPHECINDTVPDESYIIEAIIHLRENSKK